MSPHLARAQLLYQQSRYDQAEQEVRQALLEQPQDGYAHSLLGLCLMRQDKLPEAQQEVQQAIVHEPDNPYPHYCLSVVLDHRNRYPEAERAVREALRLDPANSDYYAQMAAVLFNRKKWKASLEAAERGLQHEGEHAGCSNLRSMALTKLGRRDEAIATVDQSLARDPDDELAHTNKGWALLHAGKPKQALEHFREALRLDPNFDYARQGTIEALKARNPIYRWMLGYFLWMASLDRRVQWGVILGGYFGYRFLSGFAESNPEWQPWIAPLLIVYLVFVFLTWFSYPLFNLMLRLNKFGRHALSRDQRMGSNWLGLCLAVGVVSIVIFLFTSYDIAILFVVYALVMAMPLVTIYVCDVGWPRQAMALFATAMGTLGGIAIVCAILDVEVWQSLLGLFGLGFFATPWLANYLAGVTVRK